MKPQTRYLVASVLLHVIVFGSLFLSAFFHRKPPQIQVIEAALVQGGKPAKAAPVPAPEPVPEPPAPVPEPPKPEPPKPKPEPPKPSPEEVQKKKAEQEEARKQEAKRIKEEADRKLQEEKKKKQEEQQKKAEEERLRKEELARLQKEEADERKRMLEEERRQIEEARRQREAEEKARRDALAAAAAAEQAARDAAIVGAAQAQWGDLIAARVRKVWQRPLGSADRFSCVVEVNLLPNAEVVSARVVRTCGSAALDRSVEQAVLKASPLPPPDPRAFERTLRITFCPAQNACQ